MGLRRESKGEIAMPYNSTTGIISIDTSTTPNRGVSISDIQSALGRGVGDLGLLCSDQEWYDDNGTPALRQVGKINPYAKYKPVRHATLTTPNDTQRKAINYGITAPVASNAPADTKLTAWTYDPPRGKGGGANGANEWYRMLDFENYCSKATSPIIGRGDLEITQAGGPVYPAVFPNAVGSMTFGDYGDLGTWYLCIFMVGSDSQHLPYVKTASAPFGTNFAPSLSLEYSELTPFNNGTEYYLCLCDTVQTSFGSPPAGARYLPLPYFQGDTLNNYTGTITKRTGYDIRLSFDMAFNTYSPPPAQYFSAPAPGVPNYFSPLPSPEQITDRTRYFLNVYQSTSFTLRFQITSMTDTIYGNYIYANVSPSFYGSPTTRRQVTIYQYANNTVSQVTGALQTGVTYIATLYEDALVLDSNNQRAGIVPATKTELKPVTVSFYDGGGENSVKIGQVSLGITNG